MEFETFTASLVDNLPPTAVSAYLQALWYDAHGDWDKAHHIIQDFPGAEASWIHAYLHRKEGDAGNARYWYSKAGKPFPQTSLQQEWEHIVKALL